MANLLILLNSIDCRDIVVRNISRLLCAHVLCKPPITVPTIHKTPSKYLQQSLYRVFHKKQPL